MDDAVSIATIAVVAVVFLAGIMRGNGGGDDGGCGHEKVSRLVRLHGLGRAVHKMEGRDVRTLGDLLDQRGERR